MNWYFIALLASAFADLGIHIAKHGEPNGSQYNVWVELASLSFQLFLIIKAIETGF